MDDATARSVLSADTSAIVEEQQVRRWREMPALEKARLVTALSRAVDAMALAGIAQRHPGASPRERFLRLAVLKLGADLAQKAYPDISTLSDRS